MDRITEIKNTMDALYEGGHQYLTNLPPTEQQAANQRQSAVLEGRLRRAGVATVAASYGILALRIAR